MAARQSPEWAEQQRVGSLAPTDGDTAIRMALADPALFEPMQDPPFAHRRRTGAISRLAGDRIGDRHIGRRRLGNKTVHKLHPPKGLPLQPSLSPLAQRW